ncbi:glutaredoxin domain-containing protein [Cognatilysobacter segetis]|uniref:glutaredoxin domain-containing protein n=1 Tax=Cognatilysobacter segetis TaxID=2492394 RepID=UPI00105DB7DA|nr:glutaredoxin [Lysobacter segetis]
MQNAHAHASNRATLYRMVLPDHVCPFGLKALDLLTRNGFDVDDRLLTSREATDAFKREHGLTTTPLVFIGDRRVGGADELERWLAQRH